MLRKKYTQHTKLPIASLLDLFGKLIATDICVFFAILLHTAPRTPHSRCSKFLSAVSYPPRGRVGGSPSRHLGAGVAAQPAGPDDRQGGRGGLGQAGLRPRAAGPGELPAPFPSAPGSDCRADQSQAGETAALAEARLRVADLASRAEQQQRTILELQDELEHVSNAACGCVALRLWLCGSGSNGFMSLRC